ncbi:MAG: tetratricopeptide repeat protein [Woeseia sp.]
MTLVHADHIPGFMILAVSALLAQPLAHAQASAGSSDPADEELTEVVLPGTIGSGEYDAELDEDLAFPATPPTPPASARDRLQNLFRLYRDAMNDQMYAEADTLAKQIVELTIEINGLDNGETARAITNLAIAQHSSQDYESAELNFQAAIDITERISDRLNDALINPLKGLAATQLALGKVELATNTYLRANHISQVNFGPHNLEQIETLESLAESYLAADNVDAAMDLQERIFTLQSRNVDPDSEDLIPALLGQARWLHRLRMYDRERAAWRRVINILQNSRGSDDLSLIPPLTGLGNSYLFVSFDESNYNMVPSAATGEVYLKRAMRIAENNPQSDWTHEVQTKIALADYYILVDKAARAERLYRDAWEILSEDESRVAARHEALESLRIIQNIAPPKILGIESGPVPTRRPDGFEAGRLTFNYTVTVRGTPTNIELLEAEPEGLDEMERRVARELRGIVHRPRMVDGELQSTNDIRMTHNFYYRLSDLPQEQDESETDGDGEGDGNEKATASR